MVAAVVERDGRYLLGRRPEGKRHAGLWEFPGGKIDPGEDAAGAARRELAEELSLAVEEVGPCALSIEDGGSPFVIDFYPVRATGEPIAHEHAEVGWFEPEALSALDLAPADRAFAAWLRGPEKGRRPEPSGSHS